MMKQKKTADSRTLLLEMMNKNKKKHKRHVRAWGHRPFKKPDNYQIDLRCLADGLRDSKSLMDDEDRKTFSDELEFILSLDYPGMVKALDEEPNSAELRKEFDEVFKKTIGLASSLEILSSTANSQLQRLEIDISLIKKELNRLYEASELCLRKFADKGVGRPEKKALKHIVHRLLSLFDWAWSRDCKPSKEDLFCFVEDAIALNPDFPEPTKDLIFKCIKQRTDGA